MTTRPSTAAPILAVLAIVLATLAAYVSAYFGLSEYNEWTVGETVEIGRRYRQDWQSYIFQPAGRLESWIRAVEVEVSWDEPPWDEQS